jgi:hypothetical protein
MVQARAVASKAVPAVLSIFNQLTPPQYFRARAEDRDPENVHFGRRLAREVDLSPWLSRPFGDSIRQWCTQFCDR